MQLQGLVPMILPAHILAGVLLTKSLTSVNVVAGLLTFYFVTTGLVTVRRRQAHTWIDVAAVLFAVTTSVLAFAAGFDLMRRGRIIRVNEPQAAIERV